MLVALLRSIEGDRQRQVAGVVYRWASEPQCAGRRREESRALGVEHLDASVLRPFTDASREVIGIVGKAA
jgi:hypothetical protein